MTVHIISEERSQCIELKSLCPADVYATWSLLKNGIPPYVVTDNLIIDIDLRSVRNIGQIQRMELRLRKAKKKVFVLQHTDRLLVAQAYAIGASHVVFAPVSREELTSILWQQPVSWNGGEPLRTAASEAAATLKTLFSNVTSNGQVDLVNVEKVGDVITTRIKRHGLKNWLHTVRKYHEGTYQHCLLVTGIAVDFGLHLSFSKSDIQRLCSAAMLHDIGKASIPLSILDKPGKLDDRERAKIETHPAAGYEALKTTKGISLELLDAVRHHHEYLDGSGYPDALAEASISDMVRVLTTADIFAALIERRSYKPPLPRPDAYNILCSMKGKLEWPLVKAFRDVALIR